MEMDRQLEMEMDRQLEMERDRSREFAGTCECSSTNQGDLGRSFRKG
jgi:hypothetical protein